MVKLTSDEISHIVQVAQETDAVLLAIRASAPHLTELPVYPPLKTRARFGLVTIANKSEPLFMPVIRKLMREAMR
jgi:hypothetical protein